MCNQELLDEITSAITRKAKEVLGDKLKNVILYGSYARGDFNEDSDIDIMLLADIKEEEAWSYRTQFSEILSDIELEHDVLVSVFLRSKQTFETRVSFMPFYQNVNKDGVELYG